jgi:hypothetical protein
MSGEGVKSGAEIIDFAQSFNERRDAAAERINTLSPRSSEQAKERGQAVFRRIGRSAVASAIKGGLKKMIEFPTMVVGYSAMGGEAAYSTTKSGVNSVKNAGEAVGTRIANTANTTVESISRGVERSKDSIANTRERVRIGLGSISLANLDTRLAFKDEMVQEAIRKREQAEVVEKRAIAERNEIQIARENRIARMQEARARIEANHEKWNSPVQLADEAEAA